MKKFIIGLCIMLASFPLIDLNFWLGAVTMGVGAIITRAGRIAHMREILKGIDQPAQKKKSKPLF